MSETVLSCTLASGTGVKLFSAASAGGGIVAANKIGAIKQVTIQLLSSTASAGTQWRLRYRRGWSNSAKGGALVTVVSAPAVAGTYTDLGEYVTRPSRDALWDFSTSAVDPDMWSGGVIKSAAGIFMSLSQIAGGSAPRRVLIRTTTSRSWTGG